MQTTHICLPNASHFLSALRLRTQLLYLTLSVITTIPLFSNIDYIDCIGYINFIDIDLLTYKTYWLTRLIDLLDLLTYKAYWLTRHIDLQDLLTYNLLTYKTYWLTTASILYLVGGYYYDCTAFLKFWISYITGKLLMTEIICITKQINSIMWLKVKYYNLHCLL